VRCVVEERRRGGSGGRLCRASARTLLGAHVDDVCQCFVAGAASCVRGWREVKRSDEDGDKERVESAHAGHRRRSLKHVEI
jgi:hypothetical protein